VPEPTELKAEILEQRKKGDSAYFVVSLVTLVMGIVVIAWPQLVLIAVLYVVGAIFLVIGMVQIALYVRARSIGLPAGLSLAWGIISILIGAVFIFCHAALIPFFAVVIGIALMVDAVVKLQRGFDLKLSGVSYWWTVTISAVIMFILSVVLMFEPWGFTEMAIRFMGIVIVIDAAMNLWYLLAARKQHGIH
jgi:uncharacterized membrane protein HdeD (DUF308 family)